MNPEKFNGAAGKVVKARHNGQDYWAFVPNSLPPQIEPTMELMQAASEAGESVGELRGLGRNMPNPHLLIGPFVRREAVLSSKIEGTQADITDIYAYEAGQPSLPGVKEPVSEADVLEVHNYVKALEYGLLRIEELPIGIRLIKELHSVLLTGVRGEDKRPGEFRDNPNLIGQFGDTLMAAKFVPPPVTEMLNSLEQFEEYLHAEDDSTPKLIRLALAHYQFETIHPFRDGNGRIGRLLVSLLLVHWGLLPSPLLYLSAYFERHRDEYCDLLLAVSERGEWGGWLLFFLRGVADQARDAAARAKQLQDLQVRWRERLHQQRASSVLLQLADILFESPVITIPGAQKRLGVTYRSAQQNMDKLLAQDMIGQISESNYGKVYIAFEIMKVIDAASA